MNTKLFKFRFIIIGLLFCSVIYSQNKSDIRVSLPVIPGVMVTGKEYCFNVRIRNVSDRVWKSGAIELNSNRMFRISGNIKKLIIRPGQSAELSFVLTTPPVPNFYKLMFVLLNDGTKILETSKLIEIKSAILSGKKSSG